jgi:hypothetical protein
MGPWQEVELMDRYEPDTPDQLRHLLDDHNPKLDGNMKVEAAPDSGMSELA